MNTVRHSIIMVSKKSLMLMRLENNRDFCLFVGNAKLYALRSSSFFNYLCKKTLKKKRIHTSNVKLNRISCEF